MTSDQRTSLAIIIQLRLVFLRLASSRSAPHITVLILHLIGLFMLPDISLMSFYSFQFDLETLISLKSVKFNSVSFKTLTESLRQQIPRIQLFPAWQPLARRYFAFFLYILRVFLFPVTSSVCYTHRPFYFRECWKALPKQQSVRVIGYILPSAVKLN